MYFSQISSVNWLLKPSRAMYGGTLWYSLAYSFTVLGVTVLYGPAVCSLYMASIASTFMYTCICYSICSTTPFFYPWLLSGLLLLCLQTYMASMPSILYVYSIFWYYSSFFLVLSYECWVLSSGCGVCVLALLVV